MGGEFAQWSEWKVNQSLDWHLLEYESHEKMQIYIKPENCDRK
jgi:1,4-alpha-glucan branching enzyme